MDTCRPTDHIIPFALGYHVQVVVQENDVQRYIPKRLVKGQWQSLLLPGDVRLTLREARNDCAHAAGVEVIQ